MTLPLSDAVIIPPSLAITNRPVSRRAYVSIPVATIGASVTGTATGVVAPGSVTYESAGGTNNVLVLPVTTPFATGDILTISGIELVTGTVESSGQLTLSVDGGISYRKRSFKSDAWEELSTGFSRG